MRAHSLIGAVVGLLALGVTVSPLTAGFDLNAYLDHLEGTRDLDAEGLFRMHEPFGPYRFGTPSWCDTPAYLEEIDQWLHLTDGERTLLGRHSFVVSERWRTGAYGEAYRYIWERDLPIFVSTDAILHAVHKSYDDLLAQAEKRYLFDRLDAALALMWQHWPHLQEQYAHDARMEIHLDDIDVFVTVALRLLHPDWNLPSRSGNDEMVEQILGLIREEQPAAISLFNETARDYDFSQLRPRGHYVCEDEDYPSLEDYFRAMMWLGRTEFRLTPPDPDVDVTREIIDACLLLELAQASNAVHEFDRIDRVIRMFVGSQDNLTLEGLARLTGRIGLESSDSLLEPTLMDAFRNELAAEDYGTQWILSQIMYGDATRPEQVRPPQAFLLLGQRFLIDSFVTGQVVWPFVGCIPPSYQRCRLLPDPLDVLYCLGNDDALPLLREEIETFEYAPNLSALRYIIDNQGPDVWQESLYNSWLQAIRTLARSGQGENLPQFMRTGAWQQEKMNTQLAAWAEIRHDNLLYGKQSYSGVPVACSFPRTYVEPIPAFYEALGRFAEKAGDAFSGIPEMPERIPAFFSHMERTMTRLREIAEKELDGRPFTDEERQFLQAVLYRPEVPCEEGGAGWYRQLYFGEFALHEDTGLSRDALIADIHTDPSYPHRVLHVATGDPELGIFVAAARGYPLTAYVGPVASYHEHVTYDFERLTDQEWDQLYRSNPPARPDWTYVYLADREGAIRQGGRLLVSEPDSLDVWADSTGCPPDSTSAPSDSIDNQQEGDPQDPQDDPDENDPETEAELPPPHLTFLSITPNPADRDVLVSLRLDGQGRVPVRLRVLDSRGAVTREIYDAWLSPQLAHFQWDCMDDSGRRVESGVYFLQVNIGKTEATRKITVVR